MSKKAEYHIVELYRGRQGLPPQYYLWRTGTLRGFMPGLTLYDTYEEAKEAQIDRYVQECCLEELPRGS